MERLVQGDEALLALAVCRVLKLQFADHVHRAVAVQCESLGLWDEAFTCLQSVREAKQEITLLAARFVGASNKKADFYAKCGVRSAEAFVESAEQLVKDGAALWLRAVCCVLCAVCCVLRAVRSARS